MTSIPGKRWKPDSHAKPVGIQRPRRHHPEFDQVLRNDVQFAPLRQQPFKRTGGNWIERVMRL
jgi:hypothetical protein